MPFDVILSEAKDLAAGRRRTHRQILRFAQDDIGTDP